MKPRKSAQQRTVGLNRGIYTYKQVENLLTTVPGLFSLLEVDGTPIEDGRYFEYIEKAAVPLDHVVNLYVDLGPDGYYCNVATMDTGEHLYVTL